MKRTRSLGAALAAAVLPSLGVVGQEPEAFSVVIGSPEASIEVVEFADFACSACAEFTRDTWPTVKSEFIETGRVRWRLVPFELGFRNSHAGLRAAWCAAEEGLFWPMHDLLYGERAVWAGERHPDGALARLAGQAGLDPIVFADCLESDRHDARAKAAGRAARDAGVRGTPTFLVGEVFLQGAHTIETFRELLRGGPEG